MAKATRKDAVHPKQKHVDTLTQMTHSGCSMDELFMHIQDRFSEANWVVSFKALILVHILMYEGNNALIYDHLIARPHVLDMSRFRDRHGTKGVAEFEQSKNVRTYASYLYDKVLAYKAIRVDHIVQQKSPSGGSQIYIKTPTDIKLMLLEVSTVQKQLHSVLKNGFPSDTLNNETTFSAYRYCLRDMLKLFQVMNLGVMKMLKVYFDMQEDDMRRALDLYKRFVKLTDRADEYLKTARQFEGIFGFSIPSLTHAPLKLSKALEEFLNMPRSERIATAREMKSNRRPSPPPPASMSSTARALDKGRAKPNYGLKLKPEFGGSSKPVEKPVAAAVQKEAVKSSAEAAAAAKEIDFIDFFSSIDDETTTMDNQMTQQQVPQPQVQNDLAGMDAMFHALSNPFAASMQQQQQTPFNPEAIQQQPQPQPQPQQQQQQQINQTLFNPASMLQQPSMIQQQETVVFQQQPPMIQQQDTISANNPFRQSMFPAANDNNPFAQRQTMYLANSTTPQQSSQTTANSNFANFDFFK